jgi:hypothetical protein
MCSAIIAGIMIFGILFDEDRAVFLRLKLMDMVYEKYNGVNCMGLKKSEGCTALISDIADMTEMIIQQEMEENPVP